MAASSMGKSLEDCMTCCVCFEPYDCPKLLQCQHTLCTVCVRQLTERQRIKCPLCKRVTHANAVKDNLTMKQVMDAIASNDDQSHLKETYPEKPKLDVVSKAITALKQEMEQKLEIVVRHQQEAVTGIEEARTEVAAKLNDHFDAEMEKVNSKMETCKEDIKRMYTAEIEKLKEMSKLRKKKNYYNHWSIEEEVKEITNNLDQLTRKTPVEVTFQNKDLNSEAFDRFKATKVKVTTAKENLQVAVEEVDFSDYKDVVFRLVEIWKGSSAIKTMLMVKNELWCLVEDGIEVFTTGLSGRLTLSRKIGFSREIREAQGMCMVNQEIIVVATWNSISPVFDVHGILLHTQLRGCYYTVCSGQDSLFALKKGQDGSGIVRIDCFHYSQNSLDLVREIKTDLQGWFGQWHSGMTAQVIDNFIYICCESYHGIHKVSLSTGNTMQVHGNRSALEDFMGNIFQTVTGKRKILAHDKNQKLLMLCPTLGVVDLRIKGPAFEISIEEPKHSNSASSAFTIERPTKQTAAVLMPNGEKLFVATTSPDGVEILSYSTRTLSFI